MADLEGYAFERRGKTLVPCDFVAEEFLAELKEGREILVSTRRPRSPQHHRWFFALLRTVRDNSDRWGSEEHLLEDLKFAVGHVRRSINPLTGKESIIAKSINFASMAEDEFRRFRDRCLFVLGQHLGVDPLTLMKEVDNTQQRRRKNA